jgi:hypothetical protein
MFHSYFHQIILVLVIGPTAFILPVIFIHCGVFNFYVTVPKNVPSPASVLISSNYFCQQLQDLPSKADITWLVGVVPRLCR